jgi:hypothetical protein
VLCVLYGKDKKKKKGKKPGSQNKEVGIKYKDTTAK